MSDSPDIKAKAPFPASALSNLACAIEVARLHPTHVMLLSRGDFRRGLDGEYATGAYCMRALQNLGDYKG